MFAAIQFPFADVRHFIEADTGRLTAPPWPLVDPERHFVRSVGAVRRRLRGGVSDWAGEEWLCDAHGALKFATPAGATMRVAEDGPVVVPTFRRLFATGHTRYPGAVVRIDVGFELAPRRRNRPTYGPVHPRELALSCLTVPVRVPGALRTPVELMTVRSGLAQRLLTVTTSLTAVPGHVDRWWISAGCPLVLVEAPYRPGDFPDLDGLGVLQRSEWPTPDEPMLAQHFLYLSRRGLTVPVWVLLYDPDVAPHVRRNLRVHLWRVHHEREVLRVVLRLCVEGKLSPSKSGPLRDYLARQSDRLRQARTEGLPQRELLAYAYQLDHLVNEAEVKTLRDMLEDLGSTGLVNSVMPLATPPPIPAGPANVLFFTSGGNVTIGGNSQDIHSSGPIGAIIGGGASVSGGTFQGVGGPTPDALTSAQLEQLRVELARLRAQLRQEATEPEHDLAVADVARAEQAAKENKPDEARSALARAGKWVLDIATRIGVPLATEILKKSIEG